jgi:predicted MFS family arabinose efflux permease
MITGFFSAGVSNITMSVVLKPISDELGWSRALTAAAVTMGSAYRRSAFGRRSYGAISSVLDPFHKGGLGLGALLAGMAFDFTGNYQAIFSIFFANYLVSALLIFWARPSAGEQDLRRRMMLKKGRDNEFSF